MHEEIRVTVCKYPDRANLVLRYVDPLTGKQQTKSAGTRDEAKAIGAAAVWQDEIRTGRYAPPSRMTWADFRKRYEAEKLTALSVNNLRTFRGRRQTTWSAYESRPAGQADGRVLLDVPSKTTRRGQTRSNHRNDLAAPAGFAIVGR